MGKRKKNMKTASGGKQSSLKLMKKFNQMMKKYSKSTAKAKKPRKDFTSVKMPIKPKRESKPISPYK